VNVPRNYGIASKACQNIGLEKGDSSFPVQAVPLCSC
jgi:hypothetical protein